MTKLVHHRANNALLADAVETADRAKTRLGQTANTLARQVHSPHARASDSQVVPLPDMVRRAEICAEEGRQSTMVVGKIAGKGDVNL